MPRYDCPEVSHEEGNVHVIMEQACHHCFAEYFGEPGLRCSISVGILDPSEIVRCKSYDHAYEMEYEGICVVQCPK